MHPQQPLPQLLLTDEQRAQLEKAKDWDALAAMCLQQCRGIRDTDQELSRFVMLQTDV